MRIMRILLSFVFCALAVIYVNRPADPRSDAAGGFRAKASVGSEAGLLDKVVETSLSFQQSLSGLVGGDDTAVEAPDVRSGHPETSLPQIASRGKTSMKSVAVSTHMAAIAEKQLVEQRLRNGLLGQIMGKRLSDHTLSQGGARFIRPGN